MAFRFRPGPTVPPRTFFPPYKDSLPTPTRPPRPTVRVITDPRDGTRDYFVTPEVAAAYLQHLGKIECYSDGPDLYDPERKYGHLAASRIRRAT